MTPPDRKALLRHAFIHFANLATDVAHDVASPLQFMTGYLDHLQNQLKSPQIDRDELERIHSKLRQSIDRFRRTLVALTTERQKVHVAAEWIHVDGFTRRAVKIMLPTLRSWNVRVEFKSAGDNSLWQIEPAKYSELLLSIFGDWISAWNVKELTSLAMELGSDTQGLHLSFSSPVLLPNPPQLEWNGKKISFEKTKTGWQVHLPCLKKQNQSKSAA